MQIVVRWKVLQNERKVSNMPTCPSHFYNNLYIARIMQSIGFIYEILAEIGMGCLSFLQGVIVILKRKSNLVGD